MEAIVMEEEQNSSDGNRRVDRSSVGAKSNSIKHARHRAALACDTCRSRRTKCDGGKPACSFCDEHDIPCNYRQIPTPGPSKHDEEVTAIRERLDHICSLLSVRLFDSNPTTLTGGSNPPFGGYPMDESIISRNWRMEFPFMTVQTPSTMVLVRLNPALAAQLVMMERTDVASLTPSNLSSESRFQYQSAISAFVAFCDRIHHWYPILHPEFFDLYQEKILGELIPSPESCLVLLVAAVGSVAQCSSITSALTERPDACYIQKALSMLPSIHFEFGLRSVQCLVILSIYYKYLAKPCQAHDYALMASLKAQALFKCHFYDDDPPSLELLRRSFWSILSIESELAYHIDMPESNIWKFDDRILLPDIHTLWHPISTNQRLNLELLMRSSPSSPAPLHHHHHHHENNNNNSILPIIPQDAAKAYFLAEIAMCRMLRRCTASVTLSHNDQEVYAPVVAVELVHQLERWYEHLPASIRFARHRGPLASDPADSLDIIVSGSGSGSGSGSSGLAAVTLYLQAQFYACRASIYWPAVYGVMMTRTPTATATPAPASQELLLADCARFYDAYADFVACAARAVPCCPVNAWYLYASLFIVTMVAIEGARSPSLGAVVTPRIVRCFAGAAEIFEAGDAVAGSPSLRTLRALLRERVGGQS